MAGQSSHLPSVTLFPCSFYASLDIQRPDLEPSQLVVYLATLKRGEKDEDEIKEVSFSPRGKWLAYVNDNTLHLVNVRPYLPDCTRVGLVADRVSYRPISERHIMNCRTVMFLTICLGTSFGQPGALAQLIHELSTESLEQNKIWRTNYIERIEFGENNSLLLYNYGSKEHRIWRYGAELKLSAVGEKDRWMAPGSWKSFDGSHHFITARRNEGYLFKTLDQSGTEVASQPIDMRRIEHVEWSQDGQRLAIAGWRNEAPLACVFEVKPWKEIASVPFPSESGKLGELPPRLSADGKTLLLAHHGNTNALRILEAVPSSAI